MTTISCQLMTTNLQSYIEVPFCAMIEYADDTMCAIHVHTCTYQGQSGFYV